VLRAHIDCGAVDEYGQITLMNKGSDSRFSRPPMLLLYSKHGVNPWHNVEQNLVPHNNGQMQPWANKGRTRMQLLRLLLKRSLHLTRKALIHQMAKTNRQILILTRSPMMRGLDMCLQTRIHPMGGIRGRKCSAYWNSKIYSSLLHPISQVRKVPVSY
jgi:hypothetical protein